MTRGSKKLLEMLLRKPENLDLKECMLRVQGMGWSLRWKINRLRVEGDKWVRRLAKAELESSHGSGI